MMTPMRTTPPAMLPAIMPVRALEWEGTGTGGGKVGSGLGGVVEGPSPLTEDVPVEDVITLETPIIAPGPNSGLSISNVALRP